MKTIGYYDLLKLKQLDSSKSFKIKKQNSIKKKPQINKFVNWIKVNKSLSGQEQLNFEAYKVFVKTFLVKNGKQKKLTSLLTRSSKKFLQSYKNISIRNIFLSLFTKYSLSFIYIEKYKIFRKRKSKKPHFTYKSLSFDEEKKLIFNFLKKALKEQSSLKNLKNFFQHKLIELSSPSIKLSQVHSDNLKKYTEYWSKFSKGANLYRVQNKQKLFLIKGKRIIRNRQLRKIKWLRRNKKFEGAYRLEKKKQYKKIIFPLDALKNYAEKSINEKKTIKKNQILLKKFFFSRVLKKKKLNDWFVKLNTYMYSSSALDFLRFYFWNFNKYIYALHQKKITPSIFLSKRKNIYNFTLQNNFSGQYSNHLKYNKISSLGVIQSNVRIYEKSNRFNFLLKVNEEINFFDKWLGNSKFFHLKSKNARFFYLKRKKTLAWNAPYLLMLKVKKHRPYFKFPRKWNRYSWHAFYSFRKYMKKKKIQLLVNKKKNTQKENKWSFLLKKQKKKQERLSFSILNKKQKWFFSNWRRQNLLKKINIATGKPLTENLLINRTQKYSGGQWILDNSIKFFEKISDLQIEKRKMQLKKISLDRLHLLKKKAIEKRLKKTQLTNLTLKNFEKICFNKDFNYLTTFKNQLFDSKEIYLITNKLLSNTKIVVNNKKLKNFTSLFYKKKLCIIIQGWNLNNFKKFETEFLILQKKIFASNSSVTKSKIIKKTNRSTLLKSPHVYKKGQQHFDKILYKQSYSWNYKQSDKQVFELFLQQLNLVGSSLKIKILFV